jgi:hypothetical protein
MCNNNDWITLSHRMTSFHKDIVILWFNIKSIPSLYTGRVLKMVSGMSATSTSKTKNKKTQIFSEGLLKSTVKWKWWQLMTHRLLLIYTLSARITYHMQAINAVFSQCSAAFSSCSIFLDLLHNSQLVRTSSYFNWVTQYVTFMWKGNLKVWKKK